ncbi:hypothetical protein PMI07_000841 [Rhizobium sp. CF080]|uniref:hypothetical protein n=1 Tax=Rhizobium sp. (strain CF080) TaxID=1144310 RepID=UPI000271BCB7|nr:hypothetical protein [Rhizobium sp. CF080]EUB97265.1 hypothetical protein PMI07_000841 [Rhizobium sp. CF080]
MIIFWDFEPSEMPALQEVITSSEGLKTFISSLKHFLAVTPLDGGAGEDLIYTTGTMLTNANIWSRLPAEDLANALAGEVPIAAVKLILEHASSEYRRAVISAMESTTLLTEYKEILDRVEVNERYSAPEEFKFRGSTRLPDLSLTMRSYKPNSLLLRFHHKLPESNLRSNFGIHFRALGLESSVAISLGLGVTWGVTIRPNAVIMHINGKYFVEIDESVLRKVSSQKKAPIFSRD